MRKRHYSQTYFSTAQLDPRLKAGRVGHWLLGFPTGRNLIDISGYNRGGTFVGAPTWSVAPESRGVGLAFDGVDDYVDLGTQAGLILPQISVSVWARWFEAPPATWNGVVSNTSAVWANGWGLFANLTGDYQFFVEGYNINVAIAAFPGLGTWHHVCGTWDGTTIRLYLSGVQRATAAYAGAMTGVAATMNVGRMTGFDVYNMSGILNDLRVYSRALSPAEVYLLADPGHRPAFPTARRLAEGTGTGGNARRGDFFIAGF